MKTTILSLTLFTFLFMACNKDDDGFKPTLPPITQTGENTFGCYVDGKLLIPRDGTGSFNLDDRGLRWIGLGDFPNYIYNEIRVRNFKSGNRGLMDIHITNLHENGEGSFTINESNCNGGIDANPSINVRTRWLDEATQTLKWYCSIENGGTLIISRYDFENRIVSGTFSCTMENRDSPGEFIEITEGRFDIKWNELPGNFP